MPIFSWSNGECSNRGISRNSSILLYPLIFTDFKDVHHALLGAGFETNVDMKLLAETGAWISQQLNRPNESRAGRAYLAKLNRERKQISS